MAVYVCTRERLVRLSRIGETRAAETVLEGERLQCVAARDGRVLAGTLGGGLMLSADAGASWKRVALPEPDVFSVAIGAADGALYAGTEPSRLFVARGAGGFAELEALQAIPSRERWSFPPRPWTHHVRWIAPDPRHAERVLVGIELGGVMATEDGGATFADHRPGAKRDVHELAWHPNAEGLAYQAAGDGAARSRDGGRTWEAADAGRDLGYCWGLAVDPVDPECWYVSAASGPYVAHAGPGRAHGRLYRRGGDRWEPVGLPSDSMPYALATVDGELLVGMADGRLLTSHDGASAFEEIAAYDGPILAIATDGAQ
jgi:photosystem II stability/assembly factor-like uncharacterized protein